MARRHAPAVPQSGFRVDRFADGLNLLAWHRSGDYWNVTVDEQGEVQSRLGYAKFNSSAYQAALTVNGYFWRGGGQMIVQAGAKLYLGTSTTAKHTFSTAARVGFTEFMGYVWAIHPVDGLIRSTDGSTWNAVAGGPDGCTIVAWQGRLVASGDPAAEGLVYASQAGDGTVWTTAAGEGWQNYLREKDQEPVLQLVGAGGSDVAAGDPVLLAFKRDSFYRIFDSENGAYETADPVVGAASSISAVPLLGRVWFVHPTGIYSTDGLSPARLESELLGPLFTPGQIAYDQPDLYAAGRRGDHLYFSLPRQGETANDLALEMHARQGWIVPASDAAAWYATYEASTQELYGGSPTVNGQVYELRTGGADDGTAISAYFQTPWLEPNAGYECEVQQIRVRGRGTFSLYVRKDYAEAGGDLYPVEISGDAAVWGSFNWGDLDAVWGPTRAQDYEEFPDIGRCRSVAFRAEASTSSTGSVPQIFGAGTAPEVGAWGLSAVEGLFTPLGTS